MTGRLRANVALVAAAAMIAVLGIGTARAGDQGIAGKKLLLKTGKFVLLSKDPSITDAGSDPVGGSDSSITFDDGSGPVSVAAPKTLWSASSSGTLFKYKNGDAPAGPSILKVAKVAGGLLKAVGKGVPVTVPNGPASIDVVFSLDGGSNRYCMTFAGTGDGTKFLVKDVSVGSCPAGGTVCGNNIKEGTEQCDGSDATSCPGNCQADCTCPAQTCGNNVREGTEVCDGTDDTSCPGNCAMNCTCPAACPASGGDATACLAYTDPDGPCRTCMDANAPGQFPCPIAALGFACTTAAYNDTCSADVNTSGCSGECCPTCGNNLREGAEECDGVDDTACPGNCETHCTCSQICGNDVQEGTEVCDGTDDQLCPGGCLADCTCLQDCGDDIVEGTEQCDGLDDNACPGVCQADCTCLPICGNGVREGTEECDAPDDAACPGPCLADCTCATEFCGNDVRDGSEECDGTDDSACLGGCRSCQCHVCCEGISTLVGPTCGGGITSSQCAAFGGTPGANGTVCGGGCVAPPVSAGDCCSLGSGFCETLDSLTCSGAAGGVPSTGVCTPDGTCQP